jgi:mannan polymerase II complex MNN11 subunit
LVTDEGSTTTTYVGTMHFALPPRKTSQPPLYARSATLNAASQRRRRLRSIGYAAMTLVGLYALLQIILLCCSRGDGTEHIEGPQDVVIVTVLNNDSMGEDYIRMIKANRDHYAARHGNLLCATINGNRANMLKVTKRSTTTPPLMLALSTLPLRLGP